MSTALVFLPKFNLLQREESAWGSSLSLECFLVIWTHSFYGHPLGYTFSSTLCLLILFIGQLMSATFISVQCSVQKLGAYRLLIAEIGSSCSRPCVTKRICTSSYPPRFSLTSTHWRQPSGSLDLKTPRHLWLIFNLSPCIWWLMKLYCFFLLVVFYRSFSWLMVTLTTLN